MRRFIGLGLSLIASLSLLSACISPAEIPPVPSATGVSGFVAALNHAVANKDKAAFDALFSGQTNAGSRDWTWANLTALPSVTFDVPYGDDTLVVYWRVAGDSKDASNHVGRISCPGGQCALTDIGPQVGWPAPMWSVQPLDVLTDYKVALLIPSGAQSGPIWLSAASTARLAVARANLGPLTQNWDNALVVELPQDAGAFAHLLGVATLGSFATTGAITWTENTGYVQPSQSAAAVRVVINPTTTAQLTFDQRVLLLTHEAVHVATAGWQIAAGKTWVSEGLAESVAVSADPSTAAEETTQAKAACTSAGLTPPADAAFGGAANASQLDAYATAQVLVGLIRAHLGDDAPAALLSLGQGDDVPSVDLASWSKAWCAA